MDFCGGSYFHNEDHLVLDEKARYTAIAQAIKNTGRTDVRMNACRWAYPGTWVDDAAFSWRTTGDINCSWESVRGILAENLYLSAYSSEGHYNDMDMLEVGRSLTYEEDKTHFGMWCIMNSPLLIGCDLSSMNTKTLLLLRNKELIALNQDPLFQQAYVAGLVNGCYILVKDIETKYGNKRAFAVYNPNEEKKTVTVKFKDIDLGGKVKLRDVFQKADVEGELTEQYEVSVPAHGTRIYVAEAETRLERTRYEAETGYISDYQEIKNNVAEKTGVYEAAANCSGGYKAGYLGYSAKNDLQWREVHAQGGDYKLTIAFISGENRNISIDVNGRKVKTLSCNSGGWGTVGKKTTTIQLEQGDNQIRLYNTSGWMPDIDYIELECTTPTAINSIQSSKSDAREATYNLQGQPVNPQKAHGIIIQKGKKIMK